MKKLINCTNYKQNLDISTEECIDYSILRSENGIYIGFGGIINIFEWITNHVYIPVTNFYKTMYIAILNFLLRNKMYLYEYIMKELK